jgi:hypothetical protein
MLKKNIFRKSKTLKTKRIGSVCVSEMESEREGERERKREREREREKERERKREKICVESFG